MNFTQALGRRWILPLAGAAAIGAAGCEATIRPPSLFAYEEDETLAPASRVPPNIWEYPHVPYGGTYAYLVRGQWYYPTDRGWMVFRREPQELSRQRTRVGPPSWQQPPEAPPGYYGYPR
jgi:hypothetical protein